MGKSVYSLVLSDEIVAAVDEMATRMGYSRSALVNHILAEYASLTTPEAVNGRVLQALDRWAQQAGLRIAAYGAASITVRTALSYKYNPALHYTIELRGGREQLGRLRLSLRSQNDTVLHYFTVFLTLWQALENRHLPTPPAQGDQDAGEKRYQRALRRPALGEEATAEVLAEYIAMLDGSLKVFFQNIEDATKAIEATESFYLTKLTSLDGLDAL